MTGHGVGVALAVGAVVLVATGCGSSGSGVVRPPTGSAGTPSTAATSTAATSAPPSSAKRAHPAMTVRPSSGLADHQKVQVHGTGFTPGEPLQVIQCAALGNATGPGDCNLTGMLSVSSDASGSVTATVTVLRGPFGTNRVMCTTQHSCLISITQASLHPTEEADAPITFAP